MFGKNKFAHSFLAVIVILTMTLSGFQPSPVSAQGGGDIQRQVNAESGRVSFISPENGRVLSASEALGTFIRPQDPAMALVKRFGSEFGLKNPESELSEMKASSPEDGRVIVRYQQNYQGIPVVGGELIVNTNDNGDLYSMSGEVSPSLSLQTQPTVGSEQARDSALQAAAKWYQKSAADFVASEPELWIFDESLLQPSTRPVELVWRMEVTSADNSLPVRELVLVNAQKGGISLHFNQIDDAWSTENSVTEVSSPTVTTPKIVDSKAIVSTTKSTRDLMPNLLGATWYVATTGNDSNSCSTTGSPCLTINGAIGKASNEDTINVSTGTYTGTGAEVVLIDKSITISGGWNTGFTTQNGFSNIDGQLSRRGILVNSTLTASLDRLIIKNGRINDYGAGIYNYGTLTINNSSIYNNSIGNYSYGGGIFNDFSSTLTLNNTTVSNNSASTGGGGLYNGSSLILNNSTISNNSVDIYDPAGTGAGIYSGGTVQLKNTILSGNTVAGIESGDCYGGTFTSLGNNIISTTAGCTISPVSGDKFNTNPQLGTFTSLFGIYPLLPSSPAIDAGNNATCLATDQRGATRPVDGPDPNATPTCDIGAYEYTTPGAAANINISAGTPQRTPPNIAYPIQLQVLVLDNQNTPVSNATVTFTAPSSGASGIFSDSGTNTTTADTDSSGLATAAMITANSVFGAYVVSASAAGTGSVNFNLENAGWYVAPTGNDANSCSSSASPCATITAVFNKPAFVEGDIILVVQGTYNSITISKSLDLIGGWNNTFSTQTGFSIIDSQNAGRGITVDSGVSASVNRFIIKNGLINGYGGGIYNSGTLNIENSSIHSNSIESSCYGGGIYNDFSGILTVSNTTVSNNLAGCNGGGIFSAGGAMTLNNATISGNIGGGIYINGAVNLKNTIISGNTVEDCNGAPFASQGNNIIGDTASCPVTLSSSDIFDVDPNLGTFDSTLGFYSLQLGSPAIDAGNPQTCTSTDQLGISRPKGFACDIGAIEYPFNYSSSLLLKTYDAGNTVDLPGTFVCDQTDLNCLAGDTHAKAAHKYAAGTYDLYKNQYNRNSIDGNGIEILSTVHYDSGYANAYWNGYMMIYGDGNGYPLADDVVAHELTHGVTQYESGLFYYYQSGAINESFSDLWGEYYDQTNGQGNDTVGVKWLIGEDVSGSGVLRSMNNPPAYGDPDKMSSPNYYKTEGDSGGVHHNSGINNKAVFLMVDGGTFNGKTVTALGWEKTGAIYYEVNTNLLTSGADYSDLYYALQQACTNLIGQHGISSGDCAEVKDASDAVQMNGQPVANFNTDAPLCTTGSLLTPVFFDDMESGADNWQFGASVGTTRWQYDSPYGSFAYSGTHMLYADDSPDTVTDTYVRTKNAIQIPAKAFLHFSHAFGFDDDPTGTYDGGVLEYSTNNGSTWLSAASLFVNNGYNGTIKAGYGNPLSGKPAFVKDSHGYISSRLNLQSLANKSVLFRWRMGLDSSIYDWGWWLDDVQVYTCGITVSGNAGLAGVTLSYIDGTPKTVTADGSGNYTITVPTSWSGTVNPYQSGYAFTPSNRSYSNIQSSQTDQNYTAQVCSACADMNVTIGDDAMGSYTIPGYQLLNYPGISGGPLFVENTNNNPIISSMRLLYKNSKTETLSELMGVPTSQLSNDYWMPYYADDAIHDSQIRFTNTHDTLSTTVNVYLGDNPTPVASIALGPQAADRVTLDNTTGGPLRIESTTAGVNILAGMRIIYKGNSSFDEIMALPTAVLDDEYWFPFYNHNNVNLFSEVRVGNPSDTDTNVDIYIGNTLMDDDYPLPARGYFLQSYLGTSGGPLRVVSDDGTNIIASMRLLYRNSKTETLSELMGVPTSQLSNDYWMPVYIDNATHDSQIRFTNTHETLSTTVNVYLGDNPTPVASIALGPQAADRVTLDNTTGGPLRIESTTAGVNILAGMRIIYKGNSSFDEIMALPTAVLDDEYWFPFYNHNNVNLFSEVRVGVPNIP